MSSGLISFGGLNKKRPLWFWFQVLRVSVGVKLLLATGVEDLVFTRNRLSRLGDQEEPNHNHGPPALQPFSTAGSGSDPGASAEDAQSFSRGWQQLAGLQGLAWTRLDSPGPAWTRLDSPGLAWTPVPSRHSCPVTDASSPSRCVRTEPAPSAL